MSERIRILVVEDNTDLLENLYEYFEPKGFILDSAPDGLVGLHLASTQTYDAIVLDLTLPRIDGIKLCETLRRDGHCTTPIIMLTARDGLDDRLSGFNVGADDYLVKPFALPELEARLRSIVRRAGGNAASQVLKVADLTFDLQTRIVQRGGRIIELTPITRTVLELLMKRSPGLVKREEIEHSIWGEDVPDGGALRSHMSALRVAIDRASELKLLRTVHREGYRLDDKL